MKKSSAYLIVAAASLALQGCSAQNVSASQEYRLKGSDKTWRISGALDTEYEPILGTGTTELKVFINGEKAIQGNLSKHYSGEFSGNYKDHDLLSICTSEPKTESYIQIKCTILVDGEKASTLIF